MIGFIERHLWIAGVGGAVLSVIPERFRLVLLVMFVFGPLALWLPSSLSWLAFLPVLWIAIGMRSGGRWRGRFQRRLTFGEKLVVFGLACGFIFLAFVGGLFKSGSTGDMLRAQFHIPADVAFSELRYPQRGTANHYEAIVQFTKAQFSAYASRLADQRIWKPVDTGMERFNVHGPFSARAFEWSSLPKPIFAGVRRVRWGNLSRDDAQKANSGWAICIALRMPPGERKSDWWRKVPEGYEHVFPLETPAHLDKYNAVNCAELGRSERPRTYILGLLDADARRLHMIMR